MERYTLDLPAMYGDHHVLEVRRLLLEMPGVEDVYASSSFHYAEVLYDPSKVHPDEITTRLEQAGYLGELSIPVESGVKVYQAEDSQIFMRHSKVFENTQKTVSFTQNTNYSGRPLWPCPGVGPIKITRTEEE
ncbi:MAG TPA: heavy-metal-associated domain-containing protein [Anaerolineales bacterium]|nr:heavy-metal-associated domain-containing protein [Anaerolineales bacterium]